MKRILVSASALALAAGSVSAAGLDRSGQSVLSVFDADNTAALSFGYVEPSVTGEDAGGNDYDVGESFTQTGLTYTNRVNEQISYSVILDQPYGVNVDYNNSPLTSSLGGTSADLNSDAITFVGRYRINDRFSVFGGIKAQRVSADVALNGQAYANAISTAAVASGFSGQLPDGLPALDSATLGAALARSTAAVNTIDSTYGSGTTARLGASFNGQVGNLSTPMAAMISRWRMTIPSVT